MHSEALYIAYDIIWQVRKWSRSPRRRNRSTECDPDTQRGPDVNSFRGAAAMPRFDLNLIGALQALLTERNVTRAGNRLNVTQPTMSGMLQRLRYQFGDELLVRVGRNMELTPLGQSLVEP